MSTDAFELFRIETDTLAKHGWVVIPDFLALSALDSLREEAQRLWNEGEFSRAEVGQGESLQVRSEIRSDLTCWIEATSASGGVATYFAAIEELRHAINRRLFLGCLDFEAHLAVYPPGAFYHKHLDRFPAVAHRLVSAILYLEPDWRAEHGGHLRLYLGADGAGPTHDVLPEAGTLVAFLAGQVHHEVLPTNRSRWSIIGHFHYGPSPVALAIIATSLHVRTHLDVP